MILLADVKVFLEIVEAENMAAAARKLGAPKSSMTRQLARLEERLGCRLIARTTRAFALTEEGRTFLPYARRLVDDSREAVSVVQSRRGRASGLLKVSSPGAFGRRFLAPHLAAFRKRNPEVRVALELTPRKVELTPEGAEIAIRLGALVDPGLGVRRLGRLEFCLAAAPAYLKKRPALKSPSELGAHDFIALRPPLAAARIELHRGRESVSEAVFPAFETDDPDAALAIVCAGGGVAALPRFLVADEIRSGALRVVLPGWAPPAAEISAVYSALSAPPLRVSVYLDFLRDTIGARKPWEAGVA